MTNEITPRQIEALKAAEAETDGWLKRGSSRIWGIAPGAVMALERRGYLEMHRSRDKARLTEKGRALLKAMLEDALPGASTITGRFDDPDGELIDWKKASM